MTPRAPAGPVTVIVCGARPRATAARCAYCARPAGLLCDGPGLRAGTTCDRPMCARCTFRPSAGRELCRDCRRGADLEHDAVPPLTLFERCPAVVFEDLPSNGSASPELAPLPTSSCAHPASGGSAEGPAEPLVTSGGPA